MTAYVYIYTRVSTEEQVSNFSLDTQEAESRALCAKNDWQVAEVFREEGASAKTLDRPTLQRMLTSLGRAKGKITHVVVPRVDRLSRNRDDFYLLRAAIRRHGVRIVSVREEIADDSISAMIVETFSVLQAQVDNLIRAGRAKTGMTEAARRGRWVWKAPIGYRHAEHRDGRAVGLELDLQAKCVAWWNGAGLPGLLFHVPNEGKRSRLEAASLAALRNCAGYVRLFAVARRRVQRVRGEATARHGQEEV